MKQFILFWLVAILIICCASCEKNNIAPETSLLHKWKLTSITSTSGCQTTNVPDKLHLTIEFKNSSEIVGTGVCNTGQGTYSIRGDSITIECPFTLMLCLDDKDYLEWEVILVSNLYYAQNYIIEGNKLFLKSKGDYHLNFDLEK